MDRTKNQLAIAENSEIAIMLEPNRPDDATATTTLAEGSEEVRLRNKDEESEGTEPKPESEESGTGGDERQTTADETEPSREDDATVIQVSYSSNACNLPAAGSDLPPPLPPPPPPPLPASQSLSGKAKPKARGKDGRRRTLRLSKKQREAVRRHAKQATKRFLVFLVSHVGLTCLVVAYSIMGGFIFMALEGSNEKESRTLIEGIRERHVGHLFNETWNLNIFNKEVWLETAEKVFKEFQKEIYEAVHDKNWDGTDNVTTADLQWTFAGSMLYSVTVITTIGYGNLTPETPWGRVVTIVYAIIGIPMTLLCLTNIGSFMAHCFRLLWKQIVCKPCRNHIRRRSMYQAAKQKAVAAAYLGSLAKQKRGTARAGEAGTGSNGRSSGYGHGDEGASDSPAAAHDSVSLLWKSGANSSSLPSGDSRYLMGVEGLTAGESVSSELHEPQHALSDSPAGHKTGESPPTRDRSPVPAAPRCPAPGGGGEAAAVVVVEAKERPEITVTTTTPWQSPLDLDPDMPDGELKQPKMPKQEVVRVPITVCLIMVTGYINLGAVLFTLWEDWSYFDSSYFCFITLSTIGFGDIVPGFEPNAWGNQAKRVSCTLYLLFGLALLAMCFELIQSECRQKFLTLARALGFSDNEQA